jgi:hypothetical protein
MSQTIQEENEARRKTMRSSGRRRSVALFPRVPEGATVVLGIRP